MHTSWLTIVSLMTLFTKPVKYIKWHFFFNMISSILSFIKKGIYINEKPYASWYESYQPKQLYFPVHYQFLRCSHFRAGHAKSGILWFCLPESCSVQVYTWTERKLYLQNRCLNRRHSMFTKDWILKTWHIIILITVTFCKLASL